MLDMRPCMDLPLHLRVSSASVAAAKRHSSRHNQLRGICHLRTCTGSQKRPVTLSRAGGNFLVLKAIGSSDVEREGATCSRTVQCAVACDITIRNYEHYSRLIIMMQQTLTSLLVPSPSLPSEMTPYMWKQEQQNFS
jgi:hypothetical protein